MFFGAAVADIRRFIQQGTEFLNEIRTVGITFFAEGAEIFLGGGAGRAQGRVRTTDTMPAGIIATSILKRYFYFFVFMTVVVSVVSGVLGFPEIVFTVLLIFLVVIMGMVMNVDFSRYQLSLLTSTIEVFKGDKKDG